MNEIIFLLVFSLMFAWMVFDSHRVNKSVRKYCKDLDAINQAMLDQLASQEQEFQQFLKDIKEKTNA